jgi:hypothetical protein
MDMTIEAKNMIPQNNVNTIVKVTSLDPLFIIIYVITLTNKASH